jgi:hypothetical protein
MEPRLLFRITSTTRIGWLLLLARGLQSVPCGFSLFFCSQYAEGESIMSLGLSNKKGVRPGEGWLLERSW